MAAVVAPEPGWRRYVIAHAASAMLLGHTTYATIRKDLARSGIEYPPYFIRAALKKGVAMGFFAYTKRTRAFALTPKGDEAVRTDVWPADAAIPPCADARDSARGARSMLAEFARKGRVKFRIAEPDAANLEAVTLWIREVDGERARAHDRKALDRMFDIYGGHIRALRDGLDRVPEADAAYIRAIAIPDTFND